MVERDRPRIHIHVQGELASYSQSGD